MERELWQDGMGNYLKIRGEGEENFADHIFRYQDIPGFLPVEITWINGQKEYVYDVSGKISLAQYISEQQITKRELKEIVKQIMDLSDVVQEYLLEGNGVVCQEDCIYIDHRSGQVSGIYQENSPFGGVEALSALVEFIMEHIDAKNEELIFWVYGLHKLTKETGITRKLLREYIVREEGEGERKKEQKRRSETLNEKKEVLPKAKNELKIDKNKKGYVLPVILLACGLILTIFAWCSGCFRQPLSQDLDMAMGIGASAFFMGVAGYGAWRTIPKKHLANVMWNEEEFSGKMCLVSCQGQIASIPIAYYPFVLGSEEKRVDGVVIAPGIERIHAQILCEGAEVYILDEESEQGTYYNDERLVPWQKKRLQDGDILRLAQTEFVVEIG